MQNYNKPIFIRVRPKKDTTPLINLDKFNQSISVITSSRQPALEPSRNQKENTRTQPTKSTMETPE